MVHTRAWGALAGLCFVLLALIAAATELNWPGARKRTSFWQSPLARMQAGAHNTVSP